MAKKLVGTDQAELRREIEDGLRKEYQTELDKARVDLERTLREENDKTIAEALAEYKKKLTPPTQEEIQASLNNEYLEFEVRLKIDGKNQTYKLVELPAAQERKLLRLLTEKIRPLVKQVGELTINLTSGNVEDKIMAFFQAMDPAAQMLQEAVALVINGNPNNPQITMEEVGLNVSLVRQMAILKAQIEANRLRDFFSLASQIAAR